MTEWVNGHIPYDVKRRVWDAYHYTPRPQQEAFHRSTATIRCLAGGNRSGKSKAGAEEIIPYLLWPNTRGWVVTKNYNTSEGIMDEVRRILVENLDHTAMVRSTQLAPGQFHWSEKHHRLTMWTGSIVEVKSAENPDSLHAKRLHYVIIDEASTFPYELLDTRLIPRLADWGGWLAAIGTFEMYQGAWFQDYVELGMTQNDLGIEAWVMPTEGSPYVDQEWLAQQKKRMDPDVYAARFLAKPAPSPFLVFPKFSTITHVSAARAEFDPNLPVYLAVDPGGVYAVGAVQIKPWETEAGSVTGVALIDELYYETTVTTDDVIDDAAARIWWSNVGLGDIKGAIDVAAKEQAMVWARRGVPLVSRKVGVLAGIQTMAYYINNGLFCLHPRCAKSAEEFSRYSWTPSSRETREKRAHLPRDEFNHVVKGVTYLLIHKFGYRGTTIGPDKPRGPRSTLQKLWSSGRLGMR